jgi:general secretion pathway protein M
MKIEWAKINEQWLKANERWSALSVREKQASVIGASVLVIFIIYQLMWSPLVDHVADMRKQIVTDQQTLVWMQAADNDIRKVEGQAKTKGKSVSPVALLSLIQKQINRAELNKNLTQLKQASNDTIEMHFQKAAFDKLITLLTVIIKEEPVSISQMSVTAENTPGLVNADVMLTMG